LSVQQGELRLGTRGSQLAQWQAGAVAARIAAAGGPPCRVTIIKTSGDQKREAPLSSIGGKRVFVKEIEDALLRNEIDLAVHSAKDLPAALPDGLTLCAVLPREDARDGMVLPTDAAEHAKRVAEGELDIETLVTVLGASPAIATGSIRRIAQLSRVLPGARFCDIRGNIDTRLRKLDAGEHDALVLATAGLRRLGLGARVSLALAPSTCVPAPGQGIIAVEIRENDDDMRRIVAPADDPASAAALKAERALVKGLGAGCQMPVGALASPQPGGSLELVAIVASLDGAQVIRATGRSPNEGACRLGEHVAAQLVSLGADDILAAARETLEAAERVRF
jgi:hydroxymethylbilane synthase